MSAKNLIGAVTCPECGFDGAVVKTQKNGMAYRFCPECNAQYFTRTKAASDRLIGQIGKPVPDREREREPDSIPEKTVPDQKQEQPRSAPKRGGFDMTF